MIRLVRLNGEVLYLNYLQILYMESIPETKIKLANGDFFLVRDSIESIQEQVQALFQNIMQFRDKVKDSQEMNIHFNE